MHRYARLLCGQPSQRIQPWQFGHRETKETGLWLYGVGPLVATDVVGPPPKDRNKAQWDRVHYASPGANRWKERSRFLPGIAQAMADQWGGA